MSNTAPVILPTSNQIQKIITENFDFELINLFNNNIQICAQCEKCSENNSIPFCVEQNISLSAAALKVNCPIGKW